LLQKWSPSDVQLDRGTIHCVNAVMADHRRDDITSQISIDDSNLVIVDECDDSISDIEIDISEPSPSSHDVEEKPAQSDYCKTASEQCLPHAGTSASQNNPWTTDSVLKNQPFIKLRRLDPAEVKRLTAVKSRVTDEGNSAKSRCVICHCIFTKLAEFRKICSFKL